MKKLVLLAAVAAVGVSTTSCKKTYDCSYEVLGITTTTECVKCTKDEVQELEDAGWECE